MITYRDTFTTQHGETTRTRYYDAHHAARTLARDGLHDVASIGIDRARVIYAHGAGGLVTHDWETLHAADPEACAAISLRAEVIREQKAARSALTWKHRGRTDNARARRYLCRARELRLTLQTNGHRLP